MSDIPCGIQLCVNGSYWCNYTKLSQARSVAASGERDPRGMAFNKDQRLWQYRFSRNAVALSLARILSLRHLLQ